MRKIKVAVGLSGGVDSAVSAYLLKKQGFDVSGVYLNCFDDDIPGCRGEQDRQDALSVALHLKLPFQVLDFRKEYKSAVIGYFKKEYLAGRTPNPDVVCNRDIKFGLLLDWCIKNRFDYLATGHYADVATPAPANDRSMSRASNEGKANAKTWLGATPILRIPKDLHKDQTYFLWAVPRQKFSRVLFPLADFRKKDVRSVAKFAKIPVADKPDSTGICFIGEVRMEEFLKRLGVREKEGEVVIRSVIGSPFSVVGSKSAGFRSIGSRPTNRQPTNQNLKTENRKPITENIVIGSHRGVWFYTIGQRHGFSVDRWPPTDRPPLYVIEKDVRRNRLVVGFGAETYREKFVVSNLNWLVGSEFFSQTQNSKLKTQNQVKNSKPQTVLVRIRHGGELIPCEIIKICDHSLKIENCKLKIKLGTAQRGVAPGQSAVFYSKDGMVLGGGVIR